MANNAGKKSIIDFVEQEEKKGFFDDQIRQQLRAAGYNPEDIENYLRTAHQDLQKQKTREHILASKTVLILLIISIVFNVLLIATLYKADTFIGTKGVALVSAEEFEDIIESDNDLDILSECIGGSKDYCANSLVINKAVSSNSRDMCNEIADSKAYSNCLLRIQTNLAIVNENINLCNSLEGNDKVTCRNDYFITVAFKNEDARYCEQISNSNIKQECIKNIGVADE